MEDFSPAGDLPSSHRKESEERPVAVNPRAPVALMQHDLSSNVGWERYQGKSSEVRVYRNGASIKAVQVLALKGSPLPDAFLKSVLKELTGSSDYSITSREKKAGLQVARGVVAQKADE